MAGETRAQTRDGGHSHRGITQHRQGGHCTEESGQSQGMPGCPSSGPCPSPSPHPQLLPDSRSKRCWWRSSQSRMSRRRGPSLLSEPTCRAWLVGGTGVAVWWGSVCHRKPGAVVARGGGGWPAGQGGVPAVHFEAHQEGAAPHLSSQWRRWRWPTGTLRTVCTVPIKSWPCALGPSIPSSLHLEGGPGGYPVPGAVMEHH